MTGPIKVYSATESTTVRFREVHAKDGSPIEHRRICPKHPKKPVDYDEIVRGARGGPGGVMQDGTAAFVQG